MAHFMAALFDDSQKAGQAIGELKEKGYTKDISVVSKHAEGMEIDTTSHQIKQTITDGAATGALGGAAVGGLAALLAGITALTIPGTGIFIAGPLAVALTTALAGAAVGGITGALVDLGLPEERASYFADQINAGETLVAVTVDHERESDAMAILTKHGVAEAEVLHVEI